MDEKIETINCMSIKDSNMHHYRGISNRELTRIEKALSTKETEIAELKVQNENLTDAVNCLNLIKKEKNTLLDEAVEGLERSLAISDLWIPESVSVEHEEEAKALHLMRDGFLDLLKKLKERR